MGIGVYSSYVSLTLASNGNQTFIESTKPDKIMTGLCFIKAFKDIDGDCVFVYSDEIDSTYSDGSVSRCNDTCDWKINSLEFSVVPSAVPRAVKNRKFTAVPFCGKKDTAVYGTTVSDPVRIKAEKDSFICLKIAFSGKRIPVHKESTIALYRKKMPGYIQSPDIPVPVFSGVKRTNEKRIAFIGDSITQGCGTTYNAYNQYASVVAEKLGSENAFWDMGLGYARGSDAASDGCWLARAKQNDIVSVCFGVNDINQGHDAGIVCRDLERTVTFLKSSGVRVLIQTVPPFDYDEEHTKVWREVNSFIRNELAGKADAFFDCTAVLGADGTDMPRSKYGSHPDDEGHRVWGLALADVIDKMIN